MCYTVQAVERDVADPPPFRLYAWVLRLVAPASPALFYSGVATLFAAIARAKKSWGRPGGTPRKCRAEVVFQTREKMKRRMYMDEMVCGGFGTHVAIKLITWEWG